MGFVFGHDFSHSGVAGIVSQYWVCGLTRNESEVLFSVAVESISIELDRAVLIMYSALVELQHCTEYPSRHFVLVYCSCVQSKCPDS